MTRINQSPIVVGIGSNICPDRYVPAALDTLGKRSQATRVSSAYRSPAVGLAPGSADFLNLAVELRWQGTVLELKGVLGEIESALGRQRSTSSAWASRTIDLDILIAGDLSGSLGAFEIPHRDIGHFSHVAVPLAELVGDRIHPRLGMTYADIAAGLDASALVRIGSLVPGRTVV